MFFTLTKYRTCITRISVTILLALANSSAIAGYVEQATVFSIRTTEYNVAFVFVDKAIIQRPACSANNTEKSFVIDISTPGGKATFQSVQLAKATAAKVTISGRGQYPSNFPGDQPCSLWGSNSGTGMGIEQVNYLDVLP